MADSRVQPGAQHPPEYREDLNPEALAGENHGELRPELPLHASDIKETHTVLRDLTKDELRRIPVLRTGERLTQGGVYIDLASGCKEFVAMGDMVATPENWFVRKETVDYLLWNKLIGVESPERLGTGNA
jgi:hypothetical protein